MVVDGDGSGGGGKDELSRAIEASRSEHGATASNATLNRQWLTLKRTWFPTSTMAPSGCMVLTLATTRDCWPAHGCRRPRQRMHINADVSIKDKNIPN